MKSSQKHIVVLGATTAGLGCAIRLAERLHRRADVTLTVVDEQANVILPGQLFHWLTDSSPATKTVAPVASLLQSFAIKFKREHVRGLSVTSRTVKLANEDLPYDYLVLALPGVIPGNVARGISDHAFSVSTYSGAAVLKKVMRSLTRSAGGEQVTVVGSGEEAVTIASACRLLGGPELSASIVSLDNQLLPHRPVRQSRVLTQVLKDRGLPVYLHASIKNVNSHGLVLADGRVIPFTILIWAGHRNAPAWLEPCGFVESGALSTRKTGQVSGLARVYAIGPLSRLPRAYSMISEDTIAHTVADNIMRQLVDSPAEEFPVTSKPLHIALSGSQAFYVPARGWPAGVISHALIRWQTWWQRSHLLPARWLWRSPDAK